MAEAVGVDPSPVFVAKAASSRPSWATSPYDQITVALGDLDPLQDCIEALKAEFVNDPWLVRRLPALLRSVGFSLHGSRSHGYLQTDQPEYMLTSWTGARTRSRRGGESDPSCAPR